MQIEQGKSYRNRVGEKRGPLRPYDKGDPFTDGTWTYRLDGNWGGHYGAAPHDLDLIAEWADGPVVTETVTKTRIVPGTYGKVSVGEIDIDHENKFVKVQLLGSVWINADELDAAAAVLSALAKGLRDA